jgi:hypothetical protein
MGRQWRELQSDSGFDELRRCLPWERSVPVGYSGAAFGLLNGNYRTSEVHAMYFARGKTLRACQLRRTRRAPLFSSTLSPGPAQPAHTLQAHCNCIHTFMPRSAVLRFSVPPHSLRPLMSSVILPIAERSAGTRPWREPAMAGRPLKSPVACARKRCPHCGFVLHLSSSFVLCEPHPMASALLGTPRPRLLCTCVAVHTSSRPSVPRSRR